jgi:hypothetical protein
MWMVQVEDGAHAIDAKFNGLTTWMTITWDDLVLSSSLYFWPISFQRGGHSFRVGLRGYVPWMRVPVLYMDGVEVTQNLDGVEVTKGLSTPSPTPARTLALQFVKDLSIQESNEIVGTEQYPLDNRFGDQPFSTVRQVSRESTNELSIDTSGQLTGKVGLDVFSVIKAEIEAQVSRQTGAKLGEKVTESQTLTFSVGPNSSVVYEVVWKRKVRSGERLYVLGGNPVTIPYQINYGLSCEIRTSAGPRDS